MAGVLGTAPSTIASRADSADGVVGGTLRIGSVGEPSTLDEHQTTANLVAEITYPMYETLFAYNANYEPIPFLVDEYTVTDDGLTHTLKLRDGVVFHNGEPMTAADVHASVSRWSQISGVGKNLFSRVDEFVEVDEMTVEFRLTSPFGPFLTALANNTQACTIHPAGIMELGIEPLTLDEQFVGTGPYMLAGRQADAYIRLDRFPEYAAHPDPTDGYAGAKHAWVDRIEFIPVPDEAARVAGLQAGDYEIAMEVSNDQYELLSNSPGIVAELNQPAFEDVFFLNWRSPIMGNLAIRQAFQAALDHEAIMTAARGGGDFTRLDPGWMMQETPWHSTAGEEHYNVNNPDLARQKLEEGGYDGTPIRFMTTQEYPYFFSASAIAQQQLEAVGFAVDLQVLDWATVLERRGQEDQWDVFVTFHGQSTDPSQLTLVGQMGTYPGWWDSEESLELADQLMGESDLDARYAIWEQIQEKIYTEIPAVKIGDAALASYYSEKIGGWVQQIERSVPYWNLWIKND